MTELPKVYASPVDEAEFMLSDESIQVSPKDYRRIIRELLKLKTATVSSQEVGEYKTEVFNQSPRDAVTQFNSFLPGRKLIQVINVNSFLCVIVYWEPAK